MMSAKPDINDSIPPDPANNKLGVHPDVLKLGLVSLLTDLSSEMIFSVFAIFFTTIAGASAALLGLVEGFADFSASSLNYLSRAGYRTVAANARSSRWQAMVSLHWQR